MGGINQPAQGRSPIEGIMQALQAVHSYYGINTEQAQAKLANSKLAQQELETRQAKDKEAEMNNPDSDKSKLARANASVMLNSLIDRGTIKKETAMPLYDIVSNPKTTAAQLEKFDENPQIKLAQADSAERGAVAKANAFVDAAKARASITSGTLGGARQDRNAMSLNKDYETTLKPNRTLLEDVSRLEGSLNTKDKNGNPIITPQQVGDANLLISRIFSPHHMSDATVSATEYNSLGTRAAAALQKLSANPQDTGARALVEHMIDQAHHIANASNKNALTELDSLDAGLEGLSPNLQKAGKTKSENLRKRFSQTFPTVGETAANSSALGSDPTILQYAKMHNLDYLHAAEVLKGRGYTGASK